jgi:hypothetical protein
MAVAERMTQVDERVWLVTFMRYGERQGSCRVCQEASSRQPDAESASAIPTMPMCWHLRFN